MIKRAKVEAKTMAAMGDRSNKRALLIGVNDYPNLPPYSQLKGCVNDVFLMKQTLETSFLFPPSNVVILLNEQATAQGIQAAMDQAVRDCQPDDIFVFHFSGHGSRMAANGDKPAGYDESIMPYDSGRLNPDFPKQVTPCDIRDTEFQVWLARLAEKTSNVTLIFDSCHSGSITRAAADSPEEGTRLRWIEPDAPPRLYTTEPKRGNQSIEAAVSSGWLPSSEKYVLLAACAADQGAYELDHGQEGSPTRNGAFTFFLTQELNRATENTYREIWESVSLLVNNRFQKQTPQYEGSRDRKIFDVQDFVPMRYLLVSKRHGPEIELAGGAIHGVAVGSQWDVHQAGTRQIDELGKSYQGTVEINAVDSVTARGLIIKESAPLLVGQGGRAVEVSHIHREARMPVWLAPEPGSPNQADEKLRRLLSQSNLLRLTDSAMAARALIVPTCQTDADSSAGRRWEVIDQANQRLPAAKSMMADDPVTILENLENLWRFEKVLELRNEQSTLKGKVDFMLLKKDANHQWQEQPPLLNITYDDGEAIAFRICNRTARPIHVSVLDLGLSKCINLLYPPTGACETIAQQRSAEAGNNGTASGVLTIGIAPEDQIELFFPDNLRLQTTDVTARPSRGREIFKLCVTTERHDLAFLKQPGLRSESAGHSGHPFEELLCLAIGGTATREARYKSTPLDEWLTIERPFWVERA